MKGDCKCMFSRSKARSLFTSNEDKLLLELVKKYGKKWDLISKKLPGRNKRQCKDRYQIYLDPKIKTSPWTEEEDQKVLSYYTAIGPKWVTISIIFQNRTDTSIKNRFNILKHKFQFLQKNKEVNEIFSPIETYDIEESKMSIFDSIENDLNQELENLGYFSSI